jgi:thiol-disulfide isomerase/thioredoxin
MPRPAWIWHIELPAALREAQRSGRPILVRFDARWCAFCPQLAHERRQPPVAAELQQWVLVRLDVEQASADARRLAVTGVPAVRALSPMGRLVGSHDGMMLQAPLLDWLAAQRQRAAMPVLPQLAQTSPPDAATLAKLTAVFNRREPEMREAVVRRLLPHRHIAAQAVVEAFATGPLATQLTAWELLHGWDAPLGDLDPWQPHPPPNSGWMRFVSGPASRRTCRPAAALTSMRHSAASFIGCWVGSPPRGTIWSVAP